MQNTMKPIEEEFINEVCRYCEYNNICNHDLFSTKERANLDGGVVSKTISVKCSKYKYIYASIEKEENKV